MAGPAIDIDALYRRYGPLVLRRVRRFFPDDEEAVEVLQEIFLRVITHSADFRGDASPATWLYQIATRHCLGRLRDTTRRRTLMEDRGEISWAPTVTRPVQEHVALVDSLWRTLDPQLVEIGVYYHLDGMTHAEIAELLGVSRRTVGNRLDELAARAKATEGES